MQNRFDLVQTGGLWAYTLLQTSSYNALVSGTYLDEWSNPIFTHLYTATAGASSLLDLYRNTTGSTGFLPQNAFCCILDVVTGTVSVGFDGSPVQGYTGTGRHRLPLNQYQTIRLGPKPQRSNSDPLPDPNVFSTVLSFTQVSVTTSARQLLANPNAQRKSVQIYNSDASAYLYVGYDSSVNSTNRHIIRIAPVTLQEISAGPGVDLWVVGSGSLTANVAEVC